MATTGIYTPKSFALSLILGAFLIVGLSSCEKRVTPNKVERIIVKDSWKISIFVFQDQNIEAVYASVTLDFGETNGISSLPAITPVANWDMDISKDPTVFNIYNVSDPLYAPLSDDWTVTTCNGSTIRMESQNGQYLNQITLIRIEI
ncbi:MAG: hypothetical protein HRT57_14105 [Crocinitomicaceae bacterium]|nr:hypothetical protein [Crocinitomicaceae bacterium]